MDGMSMTSPPASPKLPSNSSSTMKHHHGMMHMAFFWGDRVQILFSGFPGDRGLRIYLLSLLLVAALAAFAEFLSALSRRFAHPSSASSAAARASLALALTALHSLRMALLYLVMLAIMSFNVGVLIAALVGHAVGFFVAGSGAFGWTRQGGWQIADGHDFPKC